MKTKHCLLSGIGCIAASILVGVALGLYWLEKIRSFASNHGNGGPSDPSQEFGVVLVGGALATLLFTCGIVVLVIGFIKLAKEPGRGADAPRSTSP